MSAYASSSRVSVPSRALHRAVHARRWVTAGLLLALLTAGGCRRSESAAADASAPDDGLVRHPLVGQIVKVDPERRALLVDHEPIPNYMPAMTMEFEVGAGDLAILKEGQRIRAELVEGEGGVFRLEKIWPVLPEDQAAIDSAAAALRQDTVIRGKKVYREVGENLPDFSLYDQNGRVVRAARFRGKKVMVNFIYTRCPIATMCPAAVAHFTSTQTAAREAGVTNFELVSITLDPEFDTPGVLREYADARGIDTSNYSFLTGPEGAIKDLLAQLGVQAFFEGSLLQHTMATLLIDENGRIIHRADGSRWEPADFVRKMKP
ncbi:MAG TPA: SCO family protein [Candidatus Synoicihabitans sp.]|nr:SCO family protein [Candidatus Synoicihabitans sp.]